MAGGVACGVWQVYTDGITNKLVGVWHSDVSRDEQLLVRVYGKKTDLFIDRDAERRNIQVGCAGLSGMGWVCGVGWSVRGGLELWQR